MLPSNKKTALFASFTATVCFLALYVYQHRQGKTGHVDNLLLWFTGGLQTNAGYMSRGVKAIADRYVFLTETAKKNEQLERDLEETRARLVQLQEAELENRRMAAALDFRTRVSHKLLSARVVAHDISPDFFGIRVDRGKDDGVKEGQGVISPAGVVGRVYRVGSRYADILTVVDPSSNIDAVVQRSRARGIVSGQSKTLTCRLKYMDRLEDVAVNDTVVSTDFGETFPAGLLIGYIGAVQAGPGGILLNINVKPAVDIYRLEEVFIAFAPGKSESKAR